MSATERMLKSIEAVCVMIKEAYLFTFHETNIGTVMKRSNAERIYDKKFNRCQWVILNRANNFIKIRDFDHFVSYMYWYFESQERCKQ